MTHPESKELKAGDKLLCKKTLARPEFIFYEGKHYTVKSIGHLGVTFANGKYFNFDDGYFYKLEPLLKDYFYTKKEMLILKLKKVNDKQN